MILAVAGAAVAGMAGLAAASQSPFVFPSLGPTALMLVADPDAPASHPRVVIGGHAVGIVMGFAALAVTGLTHGGSAFVEPVGIARVVAAATSVGATGAGMTLLRVFHAPAAATTLIISLGLITAPLDLVIMLAAVTTMTASFALRRSRTAA